MPTHFEFFLKIFVFKAFFFCQNIKNQQLHFKLQSIVIRFLKFKIQNKACYILNYFKYLEQKFQTNIKIQNHR